MLISDFISAGALDLVAISVIGGLDHGLWGRPPAKVLGERLKLGSEVESHLAVRLVGEGVHRGSGIIAPAEEISEGSSLAYPILEEGNLAS